MHMPGNCNIFEHVFVIYNAIEEKSLPLNQ